MKTKLISNLTAKILLLSLIIFSSYSNISLAAQEDTSMSGVYIAGNAVNENGFSVATYWKDGIPIQLSDGTKDAHAMVICVSESDVHPYCGI